MARVYQELDIEAVSLENHPITIPKPDKLFWRVLRKKRWVTERVVSYSEPAGGSK
jgi:hypothetical protein